MKIPLFIKNKINQIEVKKQKHQGGGILEEYSLAKRQRQGELGGFTAPLTESNTHKTKFLDLCTRKFYLLCISQAQFALIVFLSSDYIVHESGNGAIKQCILKAKLPPFCTPFASFKRHFAIKTSDGGVSRYHLSTRFHTLCCSFYCFLGHITRRHLTSVSIAYICTIEII